MPKSSKQKLKLLYLMKILLEKTDENDSITVTEIIEELSHYDILAERKSIYDDLEALRVYGYHIEKVKSKTTSYYIANHIFELSELKILVDLVQSSKFITHNKSLELIKKIESLASCNQAKELHRQVYVLNRVKTMNESIYYNIDKIHNAIMNDRKITFKYFTYAVTKEVQFRRNGQKYLISPFALICNDENYYLIGFDSNSNMIKHYRVDKMMDIIITDEKCEGKDAFKQFDMGLYSRRVFSMFSGKNENIKLQLANHLIGVIIDRFGTEIPISRVNENEFSIFVTIQASPRFYGWLASFGTDAKIISPQYVKDAYKEYIKKIMKSL